MLVTEQGTKLDDGSVAVAQGDSVEIALHRVHVHVDRGDVELVNGRIAVSRDAQDRFRVRTLTSRDHPLGRPDVTLSLGDRAFVGD